MNTWYAFLNGLKGHNSIAQGNALGKGLRKNVNALSEHNSLLNCDHTMDTIQNNTVPSAITSFPPAMVYTGLPLKVMPVKGQLRDFE